VKLRVVWIFPPLDALPQTSTVAPHLEALRLLDVTSHQSEFKRADF